MQFLYVSFVMFVLLNMFVIVVVFLFVCSFYAVELKPGQPSLPMGLSMSHMGIKYKFTNYLVVLFYHY